MTAKTPDPRLVACDTIVARAAQMMQDEVNAPLGMILDRLLTFSAAQACFSDGSEAAAKCFRHIAEQIEAGVFNRVRAEGPRH